MVFEYIFYILLTPLFIDPTLSVLVCMLIIDGVRYQLWTPMNEEKEFHPLVRENANEIFVDRADLVVLTVGCRIHNK